MKLRRRKTSHTDTPQCGGTHIIRLLGWWCAFVPSAQHCNTIFVDLLCLGNNCGGRLGLYRTFSAHIFFNCMTWCRIGPELCAVSYIPYISFYWMFRIRSNSFRFGFVARSALKKNNFGAFDGFYSFFLRSSHFQNGQTCRMVLRLDSNF